MLLYPQFYKLYGLRRVENLISPRINDRVNLILPKGMVYHYLPEDTVVKGVPPDHWAVKDSQRLVMVDHITELDEKANEGNPRKTTVLPITEIKEYHSRFRKLKLLRDLERNTRDLKTPLVVNYAILPSLYRYVQSFFAEFNKRQNIIHTLWYNVNDLALKLEGRQTFVSLDLPDILPSLGSLRKAQRSMTHALLEEFNSYETQTILELWKWLGPNREDSAISQVSAEALSKVNLIVIRDTKWMMINLGLLDKWRAGADQDGNIEPEALQKRFLKLLVSLFESTTADTQLTDSEIIKKTEVKEETSATDVPADVGQDKMEEIQETKAIQAVLKETQDDDELEKELDALRELAVNLEKELGDNPFELPPLNLGDGVKNKADTLAEDGLISVSELKRYEKISKAHEDIPNPYTGKGSIVDAIKVDPKELVIDKPVELPDSPGVIDKSMLESTLVNFDAKYVSEVLPKDIMSSVINVTNAGVAVTNYDVEQIEDIANKYELHTVRLNPVGGKPSTVHFKIPVVEEDGTFIANGIKYKMRKQRGDLPIRKINPSRVALTSYYGKVFVDRSPKVVYDYNRWLTKSILFAGMDDGNDSVKNMKTGNLFDQSLKIPRLYAILSHSFVSFSAGGVNFFLDYNKRFEKFGKDEVKKVEKGPMVVIGNKGSNLVVVDDQDNLYEVVGSGVEPLGKIEDLTSLDRSKAPIEIALLKVFSVYIPLGVVLSYYMGLTKLLASLNVKSKRVVTGSRFTLEDNEYAITFNDETLILSREDKLATLIIGGFNEYKNSVRRFNISEFDKKDVYFNLLDDHGLGNRHLKELDLLDSMFIDPITLDILKELEEPTTWKGLLKRSAELLLTDYSPSETSMEFMRIKGYERIAGAVYGELVNSMRGFTLRESTGNAAIEMKPFAVWQAINSDPSKTTVEESNPIKNINEKEAVTFTGKGGRGKVSMVDRTRVFDESDMGVISEATVDSGDVAINTYTTANPNFKSLRGLTGQHKKGQDSPTRMLSSGALLSPGADVDDPKRVNFITIQHAQGISAEGYTPSPLRTGYERVIAHKTDDLYATTAKQKGKVKKITKRAITVEYADGTTQSIQLGKRFGDAAGTTFPHSLITDLKEGDRFDVGDTIAYNTNFFTPDPLNPKVSIWKAGVMCKTAIMESPDTLEDSSVISERISEAMTTSITKARYVRLEFDQVIKNLVEPGSEVEPDSILCMIEDSVTSDNDLFTDDTLETLKLLSGNSPKAKYKGTVDKIEVLYYGDLEDMSSSLRELAEKSDKELALQRKALGRPVVNGYVGDGYRVDGKVLELDTLVIKIYITERIGAGPGDKGVFGNQMKTVFGRVMSGVNRTESGEDIDALFSYKSISARIIASPMIIGTTNTLLSVLSKHVAKVYEEG